jgi:glycosyltransferase involved in cell wall biosynthesis
MATRDGIVMFSPLPPRPNGIADYCFELLGGLINHVHCIVVVEDGTATASAPPGVAVLTEAEYRGRSLAHLPHIYQVGNNPDHIYMLPYAMKVPGVVVLHDPSLHYLLDQATVARGHSGAYAAALDSEYGAAGRTLAAQFLAHGLRETAMFQAMRMTGALLGAARGVIVHSRFAAAQALAAAPGARITIVPHHVCPPPEQNAPSRERAVLGIADDELMFLSLGFVTRAKQIDRTLRALKARLHDLPRFQYVIAGAQTKQEFDAAALVAELGLQNHVKLLDYVEESAFFALARAADVVINLRHPVGGETSGTMVRALGTGACVVVVDRGPFAELPDGVAVKLAWDDAFQERLGETLARLARDRAARARIGRAAAQYVTASHGLDRSVALYLRAVDVARTVAAPDWGSRTAWETLAPGAVAAARAGARRALGPDAVLPRWFLAGAVPLCTEPCRAAVVNEAAVDRALLALLGHGAAAFLNCAEFTALAPRALDLLVVFSPGDDLPLAAANAALAFGGRLAIIMPEETPAARTMAAALAAHGFRVDLSCRETPPSLHPRDEQDGDRDGGACWLAVKYTEFRVAAPAQACAARATYTADLAQAA